MRDRPIPTALLLGCGFIVAADLRVVAPLLPAIADDFHVSLGAAGLTIAVYGFAYAAGQVLYGKLGDRIGKVTVIRSVLLLFAVGTGLSAFAPTLPSLLALRLLTGVFAAGVIPMSLAYLGDTIVDYATRRRAIAVFLSAIVSGQVFGQALGGILAGLFSWRGIFLVLGVAALLLAAAAWTYQTPSIESDSPSARGSFRAIFVSDRPLFLLTMTEMFFFLGAFAFAGASLVEEQGASYPLVGALLALFAAGSVIASRGVSRLTLVDADASRVGIGAIVVALGFGLLATSPGAPLFGVAVLVLGVGLTFAHSTLQARATEVSPQSRGAAVALFAGLANIGAAAGTFAAGAIVDGFGFAPLFAAAGLGMLAVAGAAQRYLPRRRPAVRSG